MLTPTLKVLSSDGCRAYLVGCPVTGEALLVDPKVGQEGAYRHFLRLYDLRLVGVLDTHTHADHLSASTRLAGDGVALYMSHRTEVRRPKLALEHGAELAVGELAFRVLEVPGHTPDSVALHGHGLVLTGDSLFLGGLARADFRGSDPEQLFESVTRELLALPDATLVFPGHDYGDHLFGTIGHERATNPALAHADGAAYATALAARAGAGNSPAVDAMLALNLEARPELPDAAPNAAACCAAPSAGGELAEVDELTPEEARAAHADLAGPERWVDVRDPHEWRQGRIPGTTHIPLSELGFHLDRLRGEAPLYLSCRSGVRSMTAAKTLARLGVAGAPVNIGGGILGWQSRGYPLEGTAN